MLVLIVQFVINQINEDYIIKIIMLLSFITIIIFFLSVSLETIYLRIC